MASKLRNYNVYLKFTSSSFSKVQRIREEAAKLKNNELAKGYLRRLVAHPYLCILANLPTTLPASTYSNAISKIASQRGPFTIQTTTPFAMERPGVRGSPRMRDIVFGLEAEPIHSIRSGIFAELQKELESTGAEFSFARKDDLRIGTYSGLSVRTAEKVLGDVLQDYPDGLGELEVEAVSLKEYLRGPKGVSVQAGWAGEFPFKG